MERKMRVTREVDFQALAAAIRTKRGEVGLRAAAEEIGEISASTLSRVEQGKEPDLDTYMRLCRWLNVSPEEFMTSKQKFEEVGFDKTEFVLAHLRADKRLSPGLTDAIGQLIRAAYQQFDELRSESLTTQREVVAPVTEPPVVKSPEPSRAARKKDFTAGPPAKQRRAAPARSR